jgi:hypothetical protein
MLTKNDELFCHQTVSTFDRPGTSAREWTERAWIMAHDKEGSCHLAAGFGYYPNRNIMDAYTCFTIGEHTQYTVRASRELRPDIDKFKVGPFAYEVIEPLKKVHFTLDDNDYGISFDVEVEGIFPPYEEEPGQFNISRGRLKEDIKRFVQGGRPSGWIKTEGTTHQINPGKWVAERDRSWGVRMAGAELLETGVQPLEIPTGQLFNFILMQFEDWGASFHVREIWDDSLGGVRTWHFGGGLIYPYGSEGKPAELVSAEHHYEFNDDKPEQQRRFAGGRVILNAIDGTKKEVSIRPISICYQAPGGYGGYYKGFIHGLWMGPYWIDGYKMDLTDPQVMREVWGYVDYGSEFRCGDQIGYGTTELVVTGKYPRYGYDQSYAYPSSPGEEQ